MKFNFNLLVIFLLVFVLVSNRMVFLKVSVVYMLNVKGKLGKIVKGNCVLISR